MKRIRRSSATVGVMDLFEVIGRSGKFDLNAKDIDQSFLKNVSEAFAAARTRLTLLHGRRVEAMFAYVAAALGECEAVKEEDAGDLYAASTELQAPDYRLVLRDGRKCWWK